MARIEKLAANIEEARTLRQEAAKEAQALVSALLNHACIGGMTEQWRGHNTNIETASDLLSRYC